MDKRLEDSRAGGAYQNLGSSAPHWLTLRPAALYHHLRTPFAVTQPCALVRDALRGISANSHVLDGDAENRLDENLTREAIVIVIEDDASVRAAVKLIESVGLKTRIYESGGAFLDAPMPDAASCLVLDVRLPQVSGIKVQDELSK